MARLDVEWLAFTAGLKPAVRRTVDPARADEVAARFTRDGAVVLRAERHAALGGREQAVLYIARSHDLAAALRDAEASVLPGHPPEGDVVAAHRAVGGALGFPGCCVDAFCERLARGVDRLVEGILGGFEELRALEGIECVPVKLERADVRLDELTIVWVPVTRGY